MSTMHTEYLLAQDIGIYSCRAALFSLDGRLIRSNIIHYSPCTNDQGWSWENPQLWWDAFCENCKVILNDIPADAVRAMSVCGNMMACLGIDSSGRPLFDSITWEDQRSEAQMRTIRQRLGEEQVHQITGLTTSHSSLLSKILWLKKHDPNLYQQTSLFIQCKDYINYKLTGKLVTDESDAGFTQMYDIFQHCWSSQIINTFDIDQSKLPEVVPTGTILGTVTSNASHECGLSQRTLVVEGIGDGRAPVIGSGILHPGEGCIHLSSSSWISQITDSTKIAPRSSITKSSYVTPDLFVNGATILSGHMCAEWYLKTFFEEQPYTDKHELEKIMVSQLAHTSVGSNGLLFMPYLKGEWGPFHNTRFSKGCFIGLTTKHSKYDFYRSILEGVAFQLALVKRDIEQLEPFRKLCIVGSSMSLEWQQILSDVLEMEIISSDVEDRVGCICGAVIAGVAAGIYSDFSAAQLFHRNHITTVPIQEHMEIYEDMLPAFEDSYLALQDINQHLSQINCSSQC